jgi:hypothetical protein
MAKDPRIFAYVNLTEIFAIFFALIVGMSVSKSLEENNS